MDRTAPHAERGRRRNLPGAMVALFALVLLSGPAFAACSASHGGATAGGPAAMPTMTDGSAIPVAGVATVRMADQPPVDAGEAWAARPAYVHGDAATEEAYAFALYHPQVLKWMPCYCGCEGIGHRSNLDCYLKAGMLGGKTAFEEHASFCDICVKTTLLVKEMYSQGKSLGEIRQAVDQTFGGAAPGTPTELPPA
jgi:hypothetical protein